jgi:glycosyltransferase involved in cell wall biosynthesis
MKIVHYSHQLGMGGTEKCMQYFLEYLHDAGHDCYCMHNREKTDAAGGYREELIKSILGTERVVAYSTENYFFEKLEWISPDIFHIHRSGQPNEFPVVLRLKTCVKKCVETNIFGGIDHTDVLDLTLYVNKFMLESGRFLNRKFDFLYNPVKLPEHNRNLRGELGISPGTFVMGRIGRPHDAIFDPISLRALKVIEDETDYNVLYLVQSPPPAMEIMARDMGLKKIRFLTTPILTDDAVTLFYNTIDILAHARRDGETFGLNIAEAMIHSKPIISHRSRIVNGHKPFVKKCGFFAGTDNYKQYAKYIRIMYNNKKKRIRLGEKGQKFAMDNFLLTNIGQKLESYYKELLTGNGLHS